MNDSKKVILIALASLTAASTAGIGYMQGLNQGRTEGQIKAYQDMSQFGESMDRAMCSGHLINCPEDYLRGKRYADEKIADLKFIEGVR